MGSAFGNKFLDDPRIRRIVLKTAISTNALEAHNLRFMASYFGHPQVDIHAYIAEIVQYYTDRNEVPGFDIVRAHIESEPPDTDAFRQSDLLREIDEIEAIDASAFDTIAEEFANFIRDWVAYNAIREAYTTVSAPGKNKIEKVRTVLDEVHSKIDSVDRNARGDFIECLPDDPPNTNLAYPLGLRDLDQHIDGIKKGEFFLFLGAPKGRKTSFLVTSAAGVLVNSPESRVLFVSFEMTIESMRDRFTNTLRTIAIASGYQGNGARRDVVQYLGLDKRLYLVYEPPGTSISNVYRLVKKLTVQGFVPDVIFLDYMIFMQPTNKKSEKRHELAEIARDCVRLAKLTKTGVVSAHLLRREALKDPERISKTDISESYEVVAVVDAAIAICPLSEEERRQVGNHYKLRIIAGRRFEDEIDVGYYKPSYDGVTMECI